MSLRPRSTPTTTRSTPRSTPTPPRSTFYWPRDGGGNDVNILGLIFSRVVGVHLACLFCIFEKSEKTIQKVRGKEGRGESD